MRLVEALRKNWHKFQFRSNFGSKLANNNTNDTFSFQSFLDSGIVGEGLRAIFSFEKM